MLINTYLNPDNSYNPYNVVPARNASKLACVAGGPSYRIYTDKFSQITFQKSIT